MEDREGKSAMRIGYGCLSAIIIPIAIVIGLVFWNDRKIEKETEVGQKVSDIPNANYVNPFSSNAIVYSYVPSGNILGDKIAVIACSEHFEDAYKLMQRETDANYKIAVSLGEQVFDKEHRPESEFKEDYAQYILDQQQQKKLLFIPQKVKMQIVQEKYEGDPPYRSIYECKVLEPGSEGMVLYIQLEYLNPSAAAENKTQ